MKKVLNFLHSSTGCSEDSPIHMRQNRPHYRRTLNVDQQFHRKRTEETNYKTVFLQLSQAPSKHQLTKSCTVAVVTILRPSVQTLSKHQFPETRNFKWHILADSYLICSCSHRRCSTLNMCRSKLLHHWRTDTCIYTPQTRWFIDQVRYRWQTKLHSPLKTVQDSWYGHAITRGL